jgi:RNA polymerase sigma factor (sigma-70 family)
VQARFGKDLGAGGHVAGVVDADRVGERREESFTALYVEHYPAIYAYVHRRLVGLGAEVSDVVADVFSVAWRRLDNVPEAPEDRLWLYAVARRCVARAHRSGWRRWRLRARLSQEARATTEGRSEDARVSLVREAMERLRPVDREVLRLVMWEGLAHAEAAQVLGCSTNAVAVRLHRARKRLRTALEGSVVWTPTQSVELKTGAER